MSVAPTTRHLPSRASAPLVPLLQVLAGAVVSAVVDEFLAHLLPANVATCVDDLRRDLLAGTRRFATSSKPSSQGASAVDHRGVVDPSYVALSRRRRSRPRVLSAQHLRAHALGPLCRPRAIEEPARPPQFTVREDLRLAPASP